MFLPAKLVLCRRSFFSREGVLDAGMVMQKMCILRKRSIAGHVSASNFLVTGQCTPDFFSFFLLNTDHHGATTFLFLFRSSKRHFYE